MEVVERSLDKCNVIYRPHPIFSGRDCQYLFTNDGDTVRELLIKAGIDQKQPIVISLDDRLLKVSEWDVVCPRAGQIINVKATVTGGGGGGGSNPLQTVAMIALVVAVVALQQYYLLPALGAMGSAAAGMAIMMAGSMLINAVFASNPPNSSMGAISGQYSQASPTYSLSGGSNRMRPYESMPVIFGQIQFFPDLAARPYTEYQGSDQYLYQIFHFGLSDADFSDFRIGTTSLSDYTDVVWRLPDSSGTIPNFPGNVDSIQGVELTNSLGWVTRTTSQNTYRVGLDIESVLYYANDRGGMDATSVGIRVQIKKTSESIWQDVALSCSASGVSVNGSGFTLSGNSQTPIRATLFINVEKGEYDVRLIRDTADSSDARLQNKTSWGALRSYQADESAYEGQHRRGLIIKASSQLNGAIQQLSCKATSKATYWNGSSWVTGATRNPSHWFMDFAIGKRNANGKLLYGVGRSYNSLDLDGLHSWAQFCDREGLTFDAVLDGSQTVHDFLDTIARCGFGSKTMATGKLGVVWDDRNPPISAAYGMSNILAGSFEVTYATENLAEEIIVRYSNPDKDFIQDEVRVIVPGIENPVRSSSVDLYGCANKAMAGKFANYLAGQQKYRTRRIKWDCDFEGFASQRGDCVILSHDLTQWGYSGRVVGFAQEDGYFAENYVEAGYSESISRNKIQLDRSVPRSGDVEYMMLKRPDGSMTTYKVDLALKESDILTLEDDIVFQEDALPMDHIWFFSPLPTPGKKVKILSVQPSSESRVTLIATDEYEEFYQAWDGKFIEPSQSTLLLNSRPMIKKVTFSEYAYLGQDGSVRSSITITFRATNFERANIKWRVGQDQWTAITVYSSEFKIDTDRTGTLEVTLLPINGLNFGDSVQASAYVFGSQSTQLLANITSIIPLYNNVNGGQIVLNWSPVNDFRKQNLLYEVRLGETWETAKPIGRTPLTQYTTIGDGVYWVSPVYVASGTTIYSSAPASISIIGSTLQNNVIASFDESLTWSGDLGGSAKIVSNLLMLESSSGVVTGNSGSYTMSGNHVIDVGSVSACNVMFTVYGGAQQVGDNVLALADIFPIPDLLHTDLGAFVTIQPQIALGNDQGVFGQWQDFLAGVYNARYFKGRVLISTLNPSVTPVVADCVFSVDVPDRVETGQITSSGSGVTNVTYAKRFNGGATGLSVPAVQLTIVNAVVGDDVILSNESLIGFSVQVKNNGSVVSRKLNWLSQGY